MPHPLRQSVPLSTSLSGLLPWANLVAHRLFPPTQAPTVPTSPPWMLPRNSKVSEPQHLTAHPQGPCPAPAPHRGAEGRPSGLWAEDYGEKPQQRAGKGGPARAFQSNRPARCVYTDSLPVRSWLCKCGGSDAPRFVGSPEAQEGQGYGSSQGWTKPRSQLKGPGRRSAPFRGGGSGFLFYSGLQGIG